jgi:MSHA pilin protein MshC
MLTSPQIPTRCQSGFTMIELITVMIVVGILAVVAIPRLADRSDFENRGFQDETRSLLRYAQKSAVAQRRNVCVTLAASGVTLRIDNSTPADSNCDIVLAPPSPARGGGGLVSSVPSFKFQPLGDTDQPANITATIAGTIITVDFKTGYVY